MASSSTHHPDVIINEKDGKKQLVLAIRDFKQEPDDFVFESPRRATLALGAPGEKFDTTAKGKKFRCPFRTEDNRVCNDSNDRLNEVLCHFYAKHFARSLDNDKSSKVFQQMRCFYSGCRQTFPFHHLLIGHMYKHEKGKQNLLFINYLYENRKNNNDLKISDLKALHKEDIKDFQVMEEDQAATISKLMEENGTYKKRFDKLMKSNEQLLKENQDLRQSDWTGTSNQLTGVVGLDKYNELFERFKVEKKRTEAQEGRFEAEKGRAEAEKKRADTEKKRADLLEKSDEYWEEGPRKRKKEFKEEQ